MSLVDATGYYNEGSKEWKQKSAPNKIWDNWKFFFAREFKEVRDSNLNAQSSAYTSSDKTAHQATAETSAEMA